MPESLPEVPLASLGAALFGSSADAVLVVQVESGRIVLWNPAAETLFGYAADEAVGMPVELLVPEEIRPHHIAGFTRFQRTDEARTLSAVLPSPLTALHRSGVEIPVEGTLARLAGNPGDGRFLLALFRGRSV